MVDCFWSNRYFLTDLQVYELFIVLLPRVGEKMLLEADRLFSKHLPSPCSSAVRAGCGCRLGVWMGGGAKAAPEIKCPVGTRGVILFHEVTVI